MSADTAPSPEPEKRSRFVPTLLGVSMVAAIILWFVMLAVTRPPAPSGSDVRQALLGVVTGVRVGHQLPGTANYGPGEIWAGCNLEGDVAWEHVGGVLIFHLPAVEVVSVSAELVGAAKANIREAALEDGLFSHTKKALRQEIARRVEPLGYTTEVYFSED